MSAVAVDLPVKPRLEVLGVRVLGPPPIEDVYFDLAPGFTALYGLNGAGKSRLLAAVADILAGRRNGGGYVVVQLPSEPDPDLAFLAELEKVARRRFPEDRPTLPLGRIIGEMMGDPDRDDDDIFALSSCIADQRYWMLQPAGDGTGWYAVPGFKDDSRLRSAVDWDEHSVALLARGSLPDSPGRRSQVLSHPLFDAGPVAAAAAEGDPNRLRVECSALAESLRRPYPLIDFNHPRAHLLGGSVRFAEVVTNRELTPDRVERETAELLDHFLTGLGYPSLAQCISGTRPAGSSDEEFRRSPQDGMKLAEQVMVELSDHASSVLSAALPGDLICYCDVGPDVDGDTIRWLVDDEHHESLALEDLSDAQTRWACLSIAYALSVQRQENARDDLRDRIWFALQERNEEEASFRDTKSSVHWEIEHLERILQRRHEGEDPRDEPTVDLEQRTLGGSSFEPDFDDIYDDSLLLGDTPESWSEERLSQEILALRGRLEELAPEEDSIESEPTPEEIEAELDALLQRAPLDPIYLFLDEPEAGLHRSAERQVVRLLRRIASQQQLPVTVATHSPAFLEPGGADPILVSRVNGGPTTLDTAPGVLNRTATSLGISALERLSLYRSFLLVEGRHDEIVLEEFFEDELLRHRVLVVPLHGGRLMPHAADALLIADFTEHRVLAMVDNSDQRVFDRLVETARRLPPGDTGQFEAASTEILTESKRDEHVFITRLIRRAFEQGRLERFSGIALAKGDILEYLPAEEFVPGPASWDELHSEYAAQSKVRPFKSWAARKRRGSFDDEDVRRACRSMDAVPEDLRRIIDHVSRSDQL